MQVSFNAIMPPSAVVQSQGGAQYRQYADIKNIPPRNGDFHFLKEICSLTVFFIQFVQQD